MTPPNQLQQGQQNSQQSQSSMFGGSSQANQQQAQQSASKQLIQEMASTVSSLKGLAKAHPEMSESVDKAIELLKGGMTKAISGMQSRGSEGSEPSYA